MFLQIISHFFFKFPGYWVSTAINNLKNLSIYPSFSLASSVNIPHGISDSKYFLNMSLKSLKGLKYKENFSFNLFISKISYAEAFLFTSNFYSTNFIYYSIYKSFVRILTRSTYLFYYYSLNYFIYKGILLTISKIFMQSSKFLFEKPTISMKSYYYYVNWGYKI